MAKGRWGHKAVYVPSTQSVYIVGGQVSGKSTSASGSGGSGLEITNEVLRLNLTQTDPTAQTLISSSLLPTAFHSLTYSAEQDRIISFGGMTSSCSSDSIMHSLELGSEDDEGLVWKGETTEGLLRRRGAGMVYLDSTVGDVEAGKVMVFGGLVDEYVCSATTSYYSGFDVLPYPSTSPSPPNTDAMGGTTSNPNTHTAIGITDFAMTALPNSTVLFLGGTDSTGRMVKMDHLTTWSSERDWARVGLLGEVPVARVGATLVSHPTLKDLVILHGGAIADGSPSASIAFLNLTTLTWSAPAHVQPARQDARAWHSDVITPSGVLVSAFGLGAGNMPLSLVSYLDLRDSNSANWGWRRVWTEEMLDSTTSSGSVSSIPATTNNNSSVGSSGTRDDDDAGGLLKKVLPPTLIGIILLALLVWFGRRQVKVVRRRRMARHFEIENTHDEEGNQRRGSFFPPNPLAQFMENRGWNRSSSSFASGTDANGQLPKPFGGVRIPDGDEGDEMEAREAIEWQSRVAGLVGKFTGRNNSSPASNNANGGGMRQATGQGVTRTQWEEIDFGLGRIDEQRRGSSALSRPTTPGRISDDRARQMSLRDFNTNRSRVSMSTTSELVDPKASAPFLVVVPPTVPSTPADLPGQQEDPFASYPVLNPSPRILEKIAEQSNSGASAEWDQLEREVETTQPFKRSGTVSSTRSSGSTDSKDAPESLPRMSFEEQQASSGFSHSLSSYGIGLGQPGAGRVISNGRSVSTPTPETPTRAPVSAATIGYSPGYVRDLISGHAQSPARVSGDLSRSATMMDRPLSGGVNLFTKYDGPSDQSSRLSLADYRVDAPVVNVQRLSNPPRFPPPTSPLPQAPLQFVSRRVSTSDAIDRTPDTTGTLVRSVGESRQLRIANATPDMPAVNEFGTRS